ncbi:hypothetical protein [Glaciecola sp. 1036]|uniref:hypothetical protein n=1 Tax=Alteromonadaceae TaxID=72275 RepID=UPI003D005C83
MLYAIRSILINQPYTKVFGYLSNPFNLPNWTNAFSKVEAKTAVLATDQGQVTIGLRTLAESDVGNIDWVMTFPDSSVATAFSRVIPLSEERSLYCFTLTPPPAPLQELEGILTEQTSILEKELENVKAILEA